MARSRLPVLVALCAVALAGCAHTEALGRARVAQVVLSEYGLSPPALRMGTGPITFVIHDFGRLAHNLAVRRGSRTLAQTPPIRPGMTVTLSVYLRPGTYTLASTLFEDESLGIHGRLTVTG
jgi:hypothetical protein